MVYFARRILFIVISFKYNSKQYISIQFIMIYALNLVSSTFIVYEKV